MFLGIDLGTSALKLCLADGDLRVAGSASAPLTLSHPQPGWSEQHPDSWSQALRTALAALSENADLSKITAIGLSGQMHGAVLLDAGLRPIRRAILWNDSRAHQEAARLDRDPDLARIAGVRPAPGFTAPKLSWLKTHEPEAYTRIAHILLPKDWLALGLHGARVTDPCDAAGTWWLDQAARQWSDTLCATTDTDPAWLPEIVEGTEIAGRVTASAAAEFGLPEGCPVATGGGDAAVGAVALGATKPGAGFVSLGTSGQLFLPTDSYRPAPEVGLHSFAHCVPETWFQMAAMLNGARPMAWFAEIVGESVPTLLSDAAEAGTDALPLFLPYLTGERTPHNDPAIRASFYGLAEGVTRGQLMRTVIEGIAYSFADAADAVRAATPLPETLLALGGGARSDLVLQTIADATGLTLARGDGAEIGPAFGAAKLAAAATGALSLPDLAEQPEITARFTPNPATAARHADRLAASRALYEALKQVRDLPR
ncbi:xylulokinase [Litorisediminicola beolgyonensis]|uniref:Xylulose kinase n=1 Tax=Litorisediminicola beolgyonensis TaxID=1173614 RepID=A0ABW3ZFH6_9RHOB